MIILGLALIIGCDYIGLFLYPNSCFTMIARFVLTTIFGFLCYKDGKAEGRQFEHYLQTGKINRYLR